ncbi:hypothetical protein TTHERM_000191519 (macronuclear) [Tetrahymena thermophila SB210]|uniref:Uncharacterized protein n=1 Tax=Tetrahymena thermophila (strain SB210) TaxID=312017 RepID=W7XI16_TETTS|nr:hypothetical protein TTHERM_000191519 [Tetrahymena thermophila SB210]EWS74256.1 hypothetical protein TTHERM_000191519 [Tetrahymena thermophila SB210]|eukprot:XP_012653229.1 hypothetical protein TTHERM_000191519 [Tetrahymena thermophila SB210]
MLMIAIFLKPKLYLVVQECLWLQQQAFILTFLVVFLNYRDNVNIVIKNLVLQTLVISQIYDLFWNLPFRNPKIIITYGSINSNIHFYNFCSNDSLLELQILTSYENG